MNEPGHNNTMVRPAPATAIPALLSDTDRRLLIDVLKQLDGLKKQLHRLLAT